MLANAMGGSGRISMTPSNKIHPISVKIAPAPVSSFLMTPQATTGVPDNLNGQQLEDEEEYRQSPPSSDRKPLSFRMEQLGLLVPLESAEEHGTPLSRVDLEAI